MPEVKEKVETLTVDKVIEKANKGETLTKEEETLLIKSEEAPKEYVNKEKEPPKEEAVKEQKEEKKEEKKPEEKPPDKEDFFVRLERELVKPEGQEDLKDFTDREKAYFHSMRRDRKARQKAEEERDQARFREIQLKQEKEKKDKETPPPPDPLDELKKKDPTDFMTVEDVIKLAETLKAKPEAKKEEEKPPVKDPVRMKYLEMCDKEAKAAHPDDYDYVMELTAEIMDPNPEYQKKVAMALLEGKNPAEEMYSIIKSDPEFAKLYPVAQTRVDARKAKKPEEKKEKTPEELKKEEEARATEEALEKNAAKPKTTGHVSVGEDKPVGELTLEDISKMSDREFAKLPKKVRDAYLQKYG